MTKLVGILGFISSGKDTVADMLVTQHGYRRESFAGTLKDAVAAVFGWERNMLEGLTAVSRQWREQVDPWWANRLGIPHLTPRWVLQQWGTEVCRHGFHDGIWIASMENKLRNTTQNVVISDCRFPNELAAIKQAGGILVWVHRGAHPEWYDLAASANKGDPIAQEALQERGIHASETSWVGHQVDVVIDNNKSLSELSLQVTRLLS